MSKCQNIFWSARLGWEMPEKCQIFRICQIKNVQARPSRKMPEIDFSGLKNASLATLRGKINTMVSSSTCVCLWGTWWPFFWISSGGHPNSTEECSNSSTSWTLVGPPLTVSLLPTGSRDLLLGQLQTSYCNLFKWSSIAVLGGLTWQPPIKVSVLYFKVLYCAWKRNLWA